MSNTLRNALDALADGLPLTVHEAKTMRATWAAPVYTFKGRTYKTVAGLSRALFADSGCDSHSMVTRDRRIICTVGRGADTRTVAVYAVSEPKLGEAMTVARVQS